MTTRWKVGVASAGAPPSTSTGTRVRTMCAERHSNSNSHTKSQSNSTSNSSSRSRGSANLRTVQATPEDISPPPPVAKYTPSMHPERDNDNENERQQWPYRARRGRARHPSGRTFTFEYPKSLMPPERAEPPMQRCDQPPQSSSSPVPPIRIGRNGEEFPHLPTPLSDSSASASANARINKSANNTVLPPVQPPARAARAHNPFAPTGGNGALADSNSRSQIVRLPMAFDRTPGHLHRVLSATNAARSRIKNRSAPASAAVRSSAPEVLLAPHIATGEERSNNNNDTSTGTNSGTNSGTSSGTTSRRVFRARRTRNAPRRNAYDVLRAPFQGTFPAPTSPSPDPPRFQSMPQRIEMDSDNGGNITNLIQALEAIDCMYDHLNHLDGAVNALICRANLRATES